MTDKLTNSEKTILERISKLDDPLLTKRALIILKSETNLSNDEIADQVGFSARTVKRWQTDFAKKRMAIFPEELLQPLETPSQKAAVKPTVSTTAAQNGTAKPTSTSPPAEQKPVAEEKGADAETAKAVAPKTAPVATEKTADEAGSPSSKEMPKKAAKKTTQKKVKKSKPDQPKVKVRQTEIGLTPFDSLAEAGRKVLGFHFARMLSHEEGTRLGEDIEELHDMRVATRRMRAAFDLFGKSFRSEATGKIRKELKQVGHVLGEVRDMDVFIEKFRAYQTELSADEQAELEPLLEYCHQQRDLARTEMLEFLDSKPYQKFKRRFQKFVETPGLGAKPISTDKPIPYQLRHVLPVLLYSRYEAVYAYEPLLKNAPIATLHQLRIAFKGFRYTVENFQELLGEEGAVVVSEIKQLQDHLGDMNDADVASQFVEAFLGRWKKHRRTLSSASKQKPETIKLYLANKVAEREHWVNTFPKAWQQFNSPEFRRHLALAVAEL